MANLFQRLKNTVMSDLHEAIDKKEKKNPIAVLNHYLRQCEQEVEKVRKLVERQYLLKEEFQKEYQQASVLADKRKYQAEVASKASEEGLYEFALQEQKYYEERAVRIQESKLQATKELEELERKYEEMKHKLKDMYIKRMELMGRENIARAHNKMNSVLESSSGYNNEAFSKFDEIETYLDQLEHGVNSSYYRNTIDAKIAKLEKEMKNEETEAIPS
ncbi:modulator protein [Bacillus sp. AFS015802]|jgi:lia operon protein LiaH|uniref:PspA/IM30 family protein n=1 Tax=Bacillus sp. AFS015802 TaxID=2033486 RepID=UPI000BF4F81E|nr:PspA/IM30 family protein [Bacillus sp. AFS015802]PFA68318.1 modulator protein [Bacillus sp. AFS015802]